MSDESEEAQHQLRRLQYQVYGLLVLVFALFILAIYVSCKAKTGIVEGVLTLRKVYVLSQYDDDDATFEVPTSHVQLLEHCSGFQVAHVAVSLQTVEAQQTEIERTLEGQTTRMSINTTSMLPYVGMSQNPLCFIKCSLDQILVECFVRKQVIQVKECSMVTVSTRCRLFTNDMRLEGLKLRTVGFEYIFNPVFLYKPFYDLPVREYSWTYKWDGTHYRMINAAGKFVATTTEFTESYFVYAVVGFHSRPRLEYQTLVM